MKILVDECLPRALKLYLEKNGHQCQTVQEAGWAGTRNGKLLHLAEERFEIFVTVDTNLLYQQNLAGRSIAILILHASSNHLEKIRQHFPGIVSAVDRIQPGEVVHVGEDRRD